jgi:hypothetical protein
MAFVSLGSAPQKTFIFAQKTHFNNPKPKLQDEEMLKIALCESFAKSRTIFCHETSSVFLAN